MVVIGLTGGFGTGKSTVAAAFGDLGATVLDADRLAHQLMEPKCLAWRRIVEAFGSSVINEDQTINRPRLAAMVFADDAARKRLEAILHPQVLKQIKQQLHRLRRLRRVKAVVLDVPLLVEAGAERLVDTLVVVTALPEVQRERLRRKYGGTAQMEARIAAVVGNRSRTYCASRCASVRYTGPPVRSTSRAMPRETISRGASSIAFAA